MSWIRNTASNRPDGTLTDSELNIRSGVGGGGGVHEKVKVIVRTVDPDSLNPDPDLAFQVNPDPDTGF